MKPPEPEIADALLILLRQGTRHPSSRGGLASHVRHAHAADTPSVTQLYSASIGDRWHLHLSVRLLSRVLIVRLPPPHGAERNSAHRVVAAHVPLSQLARSPAACSPPARVLASASNRNGPASWATSRSARPTSRRGRPLREFQRLRENIPIDLTCVIAFLLF
jgi:hypothetical protein